MTVAAAPAGLARRRNPVSRTLGWLRAFSSSSPTAGIGLAIVLFFVCLAVVGLFMHARAYNQNLIESFDHPGAPGHILGTDELGRDIAARIAVAVGISLAIGIASVAIAGVFGVLMGMLAGFFGGWLDDVIMRTVDAVLAIPVVLLALSVLTVIGGGIRNLIIVIAITQWMTYARTARAETLSLRRQDFVRAAEAIGVRPWTILRRHILPHLMPSATALATLNVSVAILLEAGLSYLGLGVQPPTPSLGSMLYDGRQNLFNASWLAIYPGIALVMLVLGINLLGDGISLYLDPRRRRTIEIKPL
jgi:peptide/nickel transport system permease protein